MVNRNLIPKIKEFGHDIHLAPTDKYQKINMSDQPDIYVFHNYPYDVIQAPGKFNIFYFPYEFSEFYARDYFLADGINANFDLVVVPSNFTKNACINSGVNVPIEVIPEGFAPEIFNPNTQPVNYDTEKQFRFLNLGGAFDRKGHDILLRAYMDEFSGDENVTLIIKSFSYQQHIPWFNKILEEFSDYKNPPEILFDRQELEDISGYYTAADVGVYPYRGEGFGLTILENIACGKKVIVTKGGSSDDFCSQHNAKFIMADVKETDGKKHLEPDYKHLRILMRKLFSEGKPTIQDSKNISETVSDFSWIQSAKKWDKLIKLIVSGEKLQKNRKKYIGKRNQLLAIFYDLDDSISPWKEYIPTDKRIESISPWIDSRKKLISKMKDNFPKTNVCNSSSIQNGVNSANIIIGEPGYCYELFVKAKNHNWKSKKVLFHSDFPVNLASKIENEEREKCGINFQEFPRYQSLLKWRYDREFDMAEHIIVLDTFSKTYFNNNYKHIQAHLVQPPIPHFPFHHSKYQNKIKFLFWGLDPFRRGVRLLLETWNELKPKNAELICVFETQIAFASKQLLMYLVQNPTINTVELSDYSNIVQILEGCDVQILPAIGDGFFLPAAVGLSMGKPIITSDKSGIQDIIKGKSFGIIASQGSKNELGSAIKRIANLGYDNIVELGKEASKYVEEYNQNQFSNSIIEVLKNIDNQMVN